MNNRERQRETDMVREGEIVRERGAIMCVIEILADRGQEDRKSETDT